MEKPFSKSPTFKNLDEKKDIENFSGSSLLKKKTIFGKEFYFYEDGSVLVVDPLKEEYHFITKEGRQRTRETRKKIEELINGNERLNQMRILGEGKGGFSKVFELDTQSGPIAVKTTDKAGFFMKEFMEEATTKSEQLNPFGDKTIIQKMSLVDVVKLFKKLDHSKIRKPEFYGFTVKRNPKDDEIQEFQFMEKIYRPTVQSIFESAYEEQNPSVKLKSAKKFEHNDFLTNLSNKYFQGDHEALIKAIAKSYFNFLGSVKKSVPNIADLEMDNIFLVGFDEASNQLEFMLIDPIEELVFIKPIRKGEQSNQFYNKLF